MYPKIEKLLFACRILLIPMAMGLSIGIILVLYKFLEQIIEITGHLFSSAPVTDKAFLTDVLTLIDFFLIAGLLTMVMIAGYENFVARTELGKRPEMPSWIGRLTHHDLKLSLSLTIMAVSMFNLLQIFLEMAEADSEKTEKIINELPWLIGIHFTFVFSALAFAFINRWGHRASLESQGEGSS